MTAIGRKEKGEKRKRKKKRKRSVESGMM